LRESARSALTRLRSAGVSPIFPSRLSICLASLLFARPLRNFDIRHTRSSTAQRSQSAATPAGIMATSSSQIARRMPRKRGGGWPMVPVGRGSCARARLRSGCLRKEPLACSFAVGVLGRGIVTPIWPQNPRWARHSGEKLQKRLFWRRTQKGGQRSASTRNFEMLPPFPLRLRFQSLAAESSRSSFTCRAAA
jgi:hypothetical protein